MLIQCPECNSQISDKALACPHCGYPMRQPVSRPNKSRKRKRLPNGFGQITKLKNPNLRKPYRAMVTVGKTDEGRPICKLLKPVSYFETYNEAYTALLEYNRNPYDISKEVTLKELYNDWYPKYVVKKAVGTVKVIDLSWKHSAPIGNIKVKDLRCHRLKNCILDSEASNVVKTKMKMLYNMLFDYALEYDLTDKNYARLFSLPKEISEEMLNNRVGHITFEQEEMKQLWQNINYGHTDMLLIQCYSGWRPGELCDLKTENVNLEEGWFMGGSKTRSGKNRKVPIHKSIFKLVENRYNEAKLLDSKYLFNTELSNGSFDRIDYRRYATVFKNIIEDLNLNPSHKPHDARKFFVTEAKKYKLDEYAIKYIVGHQINDITESVYTERTIEWLSSEIEKIKVVV